jgi:PhnB protein
MTSFKPDGYNSVSPYLIVSDAAATIRFLEGVLGAILIRSFPDDRGGVMHAEVRIDDTVIMIADAAPDWPPVSAHVHVYVADVDAAYAKALKAGAASVQEPVQKDDDDKRGGVKDSGGTTWWLASKVQ